jgi:hypothetical protein
MKSTLLFGMAREHRIPLMRIRCMSWKQYQKLTRYGRATSPTVTKPKRIAGNFIAKQLALLNNGLPVWTSAGTTYDIRHCLHGLYVT